MARCIYLVVGGMALVLIVVWPTAICVGSELKMSIVITHALARDGFR